MKLKNLFIINAIVTILFGLGSILIPETFMSLFGATLEPAGALMMRFGGAWLIGLGLLAWLVRNADDSQTLHGIMVAFLITYMIGLVVALLGQFAAVLNVLGWLPVGINLVLTLGYGYFLLVKPLDVQSRTTARRT